MSKSRKLIFLLVIILASPLVSVSQGVGVYNGLTKVRDVGVGETYTDVIILKNTGEMPEEVRLYQSDFSFTSDGKKSFDKPGQLDRSNSNWITFSPSRVTIPPSTITEIKVTIRVPNNRILCGTYWSMIMVELVPRITEDIDTLKKQNIQFGINQIMRYGVQIITNINDTGRRDIKFLNSKVIKENESKILQVDVENTGERWLRPYLWVDIYTSDGQRVGKFEGEQWRIYPGTSVRFRVDLSTVPEGKYNALVVVDNRDEYVFGIQYSLNLENTS
jgi:hypothetical protein